MTDKPKKPKKPNKADRLREPVTVSIDEAFEIYRSIHKSQGEVTANAVLAKIKQQDPSAKISVQTIRAWAASHGWRDRVDDEIKEELIAQAKRYMPGIETDVLRGLQGFMVAKLYEAIDNIEIESAGAMRTLIECIQALGEINGVAGADAGKAASSASSAKLKEIIGNVRQLRPKQ